MNKLKIAIKIYGLAILITLPIINLILWVWSFKTSEGIILTNSIGERLVETIMLVTGVPCALYVIYPVFKKFVRSWNENAN
jgi:hypothetical protein